MYTFLSKNGQTVGFLLGFVLVVIFLLMVISGLDSFNGLSEEQQLATNIFNFGLYAAIGLCIVAAIAAVLFGLFHLLTDLKGSMKFLIALVGVLVVFFIGYSMADADMTSAIQATIEEFEVSEGISKFISGSLITTLLLAGIALVSFIVFEILNFFK